MGLLMSLMIARKIPVSGIKLINACEENNIELLSAHDALADIKATRLLWKKLVERIV